MPRYNICYCDNNICNGAFRYMVILPYKISGEPKSWLVNTLT